MTATMGICIGTIWRSNAKPRSAPSQVSPATTTASTPGATSMGLGGLTSACRSEKTWSRISCPLRYAMGLRRDRDGPPRRGNRRTCRIVGGHTAERIFQDESGGVAAYNGAAQQRRHHEVDAGARPLRSA